MNLKLLLFLTIFWLNEINDKIKTCLEKTAADSASNPSHGQADQGKEYKLLQSKCRLTNTLLANMN